MRECQSVGFFLDVETFMRKSARAIPIFAGGNAAGRDKARKAAVIAWRNASEKVAAKAGAPRKRHVREKLSQINRTSLS